MKNKRLVTLAVSAIGILLLILDAKTALASATEGITLCLTTVIPSLFPFFVLSAVINSALSGTKVSILRPISRLCRLPAGAESILILGLIGGYPVGAASIRQGYKTGILCKKDSERMLAFCNNAGPAFIFGLLSPILGNIGLCWALWIIHISSAIVVGILIPGGSKETVTVHSAQPLGVTQAMQLGIKKMGRFVSCHPWVYGALVFVAFAPCIPNGHYRHPGADQRLPFSGANRKCSSALSAGCWLSFLWRHLRCYADGLCYWRTVITQVLHWKTVANNIKYSYEFCVSHIFPFGIKKQ